MECKADVKEDHLANVAAVLEESKEQASPDAKTDQEVQEKQSQDQVNNKV